MANNFELGIEWNSAVQVAVLGGAFSAIGWLASPIIVIYSEHQKQRTVWQHEYTNSQLQELYGPLIFLILEGRQTFLDFLTILGRNYVFRANEPLQKDELDGWLFWVESEFLPRNRQINTLISSKTHLIDEGLVPDLYLKFIQHHSSWEILHKRWQEQQVPYSWHSNVNWPRELENDVIKKFNEVKQRHSVLLGCLGAHSRGRDA